MVVVVVVVVGCVGDGVGGDGVGGDGGVVVVLVVGCVGDGVCGDAGCGSCGGDGDDHGGDFVAVFVIIGKGTQRRSCGSSCGYKCGNSPHARYTYLPPHDTLHLLKVHGLHDHRQRTVQESERKFFSPSY